LGGQKPPLTDLASLGRFHDRVRGQRDLRIGEDNFDLYLGQKVRDVLAATVDFRVALLPPESLHLGYGHASDADFLECFPHLVEFERFDDGFNFFHNTFAQSL
jgi:hypothetical protein